MKRTPLVRKSPMKRHPLKRKLKSQLTRNPLRRVSTRYVRVFPSRLYSQKRKEFLSNSSYCRPCLDRGFRTESIEIHHMAGRQGKLLNDITKWLPVCSDCHRSITNNANWAIRMGYTILRGK